MIIYSSSFAVPVAEVSHSFTGAVEDKLSKYRSIFVSAAKELLDGRRFSSPMLTVSSGNVPVTTDTLLGRLSNIAWGNETQITTRNRKKKRSVIGSQTISSGVIKQDLVAALVKCEIEIETINRMSRSKGIGLDGKMQAQRQRAIEQRESILEKPVFLAATCQEIWEIRPNEIEISRTLGSYPSISGITSRFTGSNSLQGAIAAAKTESIAYFKRVTSLTTDEFNTKIANAGMSGWFNPSTPTTFLSRIAPLTWRMDKFTRKLFDHRHLHYYHMNRFIRAMLSGPAGAMAEVGANRFRAVMETLNSDKVTEFSVESLSEYFVAMGVSDVELLVRKIELDFLLRAQIAEVSFVNTDHNFVHLEGLLNGQIDDLPAGANATATTAWGQPIVMNSEENVESFEDVWAQPHPDFLEMRDHLVNILSFYQTVAKKPSIIKRLDQPISFEDSAATLKSLGMTAVVPRSFIVEVV